MAQGHLKGSFRGLISMARGIRQSPLLCKGHKGWGTRPMCFICIPKRAPGL